MGFILSLSVHVFMLKSNSIEKGGPLKRRGLASSSGSTINAYKKNDMRIYVSNVIICT